MAKNIDQITNTVSTLDGTERFAGRDGSGDFKAVLSTLLDYISSQKIGTIDMWGNAVAPTGAFLCDGTAYSRTTYSVLFGIIGTTFGVGDGSTTFNVPKFSGVVPKMPGSQDINGRTKTGPALGSVEEDRFQGHYHDSAGSSFLINGGAADLGALGAGSNNAEAGYTEEPSNDGSSGTPRTGATTRDSSLGINFIIWYA